MLKEVGASGQISLGKKYAGQLFEVQFQPDHSIVMRPVKVVPATPVLARETAPAASYAQTTSATQAWADAHSAEIEQYNTWAEQREPYSQRVRRWRETGV